VSDPDHAYPYAAGVLRAIAQDLVARVERCGHHDPWLVRHDRAQLDAITRVMARPDFTAEDLEAALQAARVADEVDEAGREHGRRHPDPVPGCAVCAVSLADLDGQDVRPGARAVPMRARHRHDRPVGAP
jgi:hypothetical protein